MLKAIKSGATASGGLITCLVCLLNGCNNPANENAGRLAGGEQTAGETASPPTTPVQVPNSGASTRNTDAGSPFDMQPSQGNFAQQFASPSVTDQTAVMNSSFMTLKPTESNNPSELIEHLRKVDVAIGNLVRAGTNSFIEKEPFEVNGVRLAKMKFATAKRLSTSEAASDEQRKVGVLSQLEALSHLSSLGDVDSAKQLAGLAESLAVSADPDLSQQSRIVLIGFELQALENGVHADPQELLSQVNGLFKRPEDRNFPSFMMLRQAHSILLQMGFQAASKEIKETIVSEYLESTDPQLRGEAWMFAARDGQALAAYNAAIRNLGTDQFDAKTLLEAIRILYQDLPYPATLEQVATAIADFEYGGEVEFSQQIADFVEQELQSLPETARTDVASKLLAEHRARAGLVGHPLELFGILDFESSAPIDWKAYEGKPVLVDFWATWCVPCLKEIPNIRAAYTKYADRGFEVIGVNMDENATEASSFIRQQNFPWKNFYFDGQPGFESEFARRIGLTMIPFVVIVGPDGNVARIHARGADLDSALQELLNRSDRLDN